MIPPRTPHDWWNAGLDTAWVILEVDPGQRFEAMIRNLFGLARDGRTDAEGRPNVLQAALLAREFDDTIRFTSPPRALQRPLFAALAPLARICGMRGSYPGYLTGTDETVDHLEQLPPDIEALIPSLATVKITHTAGPKHPRLMTSTQRRSTIFVGCRLPEYSPLRVVTD